MNDRLLPFLILDGFFFLYGLWAILTGQAYSRFGPKITGAPARLAGLFTWIMAVLATCAFLIPKWSGLFWGLLAVAVLVFYWIGWRLRREPKREPFLKYEPGRGDRKSKRKRGSLS